MKRKQLVLVGVVVVLLGVVAFFYWSKNQEEKPNKVFEPRSGSKVVIRLVSSGSEDSERFAGERLEIFDNYLMLYHTRMDFGVQLIPLKDDVRVTVTFEVAPKNSEGW